MRRFQELASTKAGTHARERKVDGHKIVDFSIGEPDFPVPDNVKQAILRALERDDTRYTNVPVFRPCSMQSGSNFAARTLACNR